MHVKDMRKGNSNRFVDGHTEVTNDVAIGTPDRYSGILRAGEKGRGKMVFHRGRIAYVWSSNSTELKYLEQVKF